VAQGSYLNAATGREPVAVLGAVTARLLVVIGALAGLLPAIRAARLSPAEALSSI
jgi:ABC-type antimicrobial peptide transport system permease subunit